MQALTDERNRVEAVERKMITQAGHAATLQAKLNLLVTQLQSVTDDVNRIKPKVENTEKHLLEACKNIVDRYVLTPTHQETFMLLQSQLDALVVEMRNIASATTPEAFAISTPIRPQHDCHADISIHVSDTNISEFPRNSRRSVANRSSTPYDLVFE